MSDDWKNTFQDLRARFETFAAAPERLHHLMVERQRNVQGDPHDDVKPEWFDSSSGLQNPRWAVLDAHMMRREPLHAIQRNEEGYASGPWRVRDGYICGDDPNLCRRFVVLGIAAGRSFAALPEKTLELLPEDIRSLAHETGGIGDTPLSNWLLLLHRLGWKAQSADPLVASRWFWKGPEIRPFVETEDPFILGDIPTNRFYSVLGSDQSDPIPLGLASAWAIEKLLNLTSKANSKSNIANDSDALPKPTHSSDFAFVNWYGTQYTFALGVQSSAVKALWDEWEKSGLGLHQDTIRNAIDAERDSFRLDTAFRVHPALGTMIQKCGDGKYKLNPPTDSNALPTPQGK